MSVNQISIFMENKPGMLCGMTDVLAENKVNMRALSLAETDGFGIVRIIVDDVYEASTVLKDNGYINKLTPVLIVEIPDVPGGLSKVLKVLSDGDVNLDYMYAMSAEKAKDNAHMIFKVNDIKKAEGLLSKSGIKIISQEDVMEI